MEPSLKLITKTIIKPGLSQHLGHVCYRGALAECVLQISFSSRSQPEQQLQSTGKEMPFQVRIKPTKVSEVSTAPIPSPPNVPNFQMKKQVQTPGLPADSEGARGDSSMHCATLSAVLPQCLLPQPVHSKAHCLRLKGACRANKGHKNTPAVQPGGHKDKHSMAGVHSVHWKWLFLHPRSHI